jgi:hypothetical protein
LKAPNRANIGSGPEWDSYLPSAAFLVHFAPANDYYSAIAREGHITSIKCGELRATEAPSKPNQQQSFVPSPDDSVRDVPEHQPKVVWKQGGFLDLSDAHHPSDSPQGFVYSGVFGRGGMASHLMKLGDASQCPGHGRHLAPTGHHEAQVES